MKSRLFLAVCLLVVMAHIAVAQTHQPTLSKCSVGAALAPTRLRQHDQPDGTITRLFAFQPDSAGAVDVPRDTKAK